MVFSRSILFALLLAAGAAAQQRFVYILAGQSNTAFLSAGPSNPALQRPNVHYMDFVAGGLSPLAAEPLMRIGSALGGFHGTSNKVELYPLAFAGSALDKANQLGLGWWLPEPSLLTVVRNVMSNVPADEVSIIWGQGETDILGGIATSQYTTLANELFVAMREIYADFVPVQVYLVTPGALDASCIFPLTTDTNANRVRDAFNVLHDQDSPPLPTRIVAHHYDLPHAVVTCSGVQVPDVHLSFAGYVQLGQRIGDAITGAVGPYFDTAASAVVNATTLDLTLTAPAVTVPASAGSMFSTAVATGATSVTVFPTTVSALAGNVLRLTYAGVNLSTATGIAVRHVPGVGTAAAWGAAAVLDGNGLPLAPRLITVR